MIKKKKNCDKYLLPSWTIEGSRFWLQEDDATWYGHPKLDFKVPVQVPCVDDAIFVAIARYGKDTPYVKPVPIVAAEYWADEYKAVDDVVSVASPQPIRRTIRPATAHSFSTIDTDVSEPRTRVFKRGDSRPLINTNQTRELLLAKQKVWPATSRVGSHSTYKPNEESKLYAILQQPDTELVFESLSPVAQAVFVQDFCWFWNDHVSGFALDLESKWWKFWGKSRRSTSRTQRLLGIYYTYLLEQEFVAI